MYWSTKFDWKNIILKEEFKKALKKDVYGFFASEAVYKKLAIPWKVMLFTHLVVVKISKNVQRGLIMYGPPGLSLLQYVFALAEESIGNGKTISVNAIMKTRGEQGFAPLYVKSFQSMWSLPWFFTSLTVAKVGRAKKELWRTYSTRQDSYLHAS